MQIATELSPPSAIYVYLFIAARIDRRIEGERELEMLTGMILD